MGDEMISQKRQIRYWPFVVALFMCMMTQQKFLMIRDGN